MKFTIFDPVTRSQRADAADDNGANPGAQPTIGDVIAARYNRRDVMKGALGFTAIAATVSPLALRAARADGLTGFDFTELEAGVDADHHVAEGYDANILIRWGDPVTADAPAFDPENQTAAAQQQQFGYNNDYVGTVPHPDAPDDADRRLMVVNHEYTNAELMFPGLGGDQSGLSAEQIAIEMAAHGGSVIEIARGEDGAWKTVPEGKYNRRITATTEMAISGPAAGDARMQTSADPTGTKVFGTFNNCAGGITPWGTWLMAEENFNGYFSGQKADDQAGDDPAKVLFARYGVPAGWYNWARHDERFDVDKHPNEPNRHGWVVEVNPADPASTPIKRTAMGRFKHEGAETVVNKDGRVVVFMGDDQRFDYVYRFVTDAAYDEANPDPDLLDKGTLSVARYDADGTMTWMPLTHGEGKLTAENGFGSQADVLIETRRAADVLEATPMDRPEDVEANPATGKVYAMLTNNTKRKQGDENAANPRPENAFGHIIEMTAPDGDFAADTMEWDILVRCGDPSVAEVGATFAASTSGDGWFGMPDNCAIDADGRLWVATDGNSYDKTGRSDGLWAMGTEGEARGQSQLFFRVPVGAEMCGPCFVGDDTLLLAVQHPADGAGGWPGFEGEASTYETPSTRWPDFDNAMPPRPSVVVITRRGGGKIG